MSIDDARRKLYLEITLMAAQLITGHIWQLKVYCQADDQLAVNVFHYQVVEQNGALKLDSDFAARADFVLAGLYADLLSAQAEYRGVGVQRINPIPPSTEVYANVQAQAGAVATDLLPRQTAGLLSKRTGIAGRKYRGRAYIPFPAEGHNEADGTPADAYLVALLALSDVLEVPMVVGTAPNDTTLQPIIWHRLSSTFDNITSVTTNDKWATQRRRGSYGRTNTPPI